MLFRNFQPPPRVLLISICESHVSSHCTKQNQSLPDAPGLLVCLQLVLRDHQPEPKMLLWVSSSWGAAFPYLFTSVDCLLTCNGMQGHKSHFFSVFWWCQEGQNNRAGPGGAASWVHMSLFPGDVWVVCASRWREVVKEGSEVHPPTNPIPWADTFHGWYKDETLPSISYERSLNRVTKHTITYY